MVNYTQSVGLGMLLGTGEGWMKVSRGDGVRGQRKIVINSEHGGFGLSVKALWWLWGKGFRSNAVPVNQYFKHDSVRKETALGEWRAYLATGASPYLALTVFSPDENFILTEDVARDLPLLVECVETLGAESNGDFAKLKIVEIPANMAWQIADHDGRESVKQTHDSWA